MSPPFEKVGGHVPRVPHQIAPMRTVQGYTGTSVNIEPELDALLKI